MKTIFNLRLANHKDMDLIYIWSNDKFSRINSFNKSRIIYTNHKLWFKRILKNKSIYIFTKNKKPFGLVRFSNFNKGIKISYLISPKNRGHSLGSKMISLFCKKIKKSRKFNYKKIYAFTLKNNILSSKTLIKSGFKYLGIKYQKNCYLKKIDENKKS